MTEVKRPSMNALKKIGLKTFWMEPRREDLEDGNLFEFFDENYKRWTAVEIIRNTNINRRTGEEQDEWLALVNKQVIPAFEVWVNCCAHPVSREQYEAMLKEAESSEMVTRVNFTRS